MASVYKNGSSGPAVKEIQKLLNKALKPSPNLEEDGEFGAATEAAVKAYQKKSSLKPDGIVGQETLTALRDGSKPGGRAPATDGKGPPADAHTSRGSFVDTQVKENAVTTKIIDQIYRYFPKKYKVISGYLTPSDLYWKVNYHWDAMRVWLEYAKESSAMSDEQQKKLKELYQTLMSNPPSASGHFKVNKIGEPVDTSSQSKIEERCKTLQKIKADLKAYSKAQGFESMNMQHKNVLKYALNPLALPGKSNHVHGWALDISGDIAGAAEIAKKLGATLAFKEETHCHCEFKGGVKLPR